MVLRISILLLLLPFLTWGQSYSYRFDLGYSAVTFTNVYPTDTSFWVVGVMLDSTSGLGSFWAEFDLEGTPELLMPILSDDHSYRAWKSDFQQVGIDTFAVSGVGSDASGGFCVSIFFNGLGDTLFTRRVYSPLYPEAQFITSTVGLRKTSLGLFWGLNVGNSLADPPSNDLYLAAFNDQYEIDWVQLFEDPVNDYALSMVERQGQMVIGKAQNNQNITTNNFTSRLHLLVLDSAGEILDNFYYPADYSFLMGPADAMLVEDDGSLIIASREGHEEVHSPSWSEIYWQNCILKVNPELDEVEWVRPMSQYGASSFINGFSHIVSCSDGSGYVSAGTESAANGQTYGVLGKVSLNGDSLWLRHFQYLTTISNLHYFNDMAQTPEGGYIMVGESQDSWPDSNSIPPYQQGWIVKVDEHGCLVPGCHLYDSTDEPIADIQIQLLTYPNPASDFLHVFFQRPNSGQANWQFRVFNLLGREYAQFETDYLEMSFILEVQDWPAGLYFLEAIGPQGQREVVQVVVE